MEDNKKPVEFKVTGFCRDCKHWGKGYVNYKEYINDKWAGDTILDRIKYAFKVHDSQSTRECQNKGNQSTVRTYAGFVAGGFPGEENINTKTTAEWYCPLFERKNNEEQELKIEAQDWVEIKFPGKKVTNWGWKTTYEWNRISEEEFDELLPSLNFREPKWYDKIF